MMISVMYIIRIRKAKLTVGKRLELPIQTSRNGVQTKPSGMEDIRNGVQTKPSGMEDIRNGVQTKPSGMEDIRNGVQTKPPGMGFKPSLPEWNSNLHLQFSRKELSHQDVEPSPSNYTVISLILKHRQ